MKKAISLIIAAMAMMVMMSACSANGTPVGLVGKWIPEDADSDTYMEIKADDTVEYYVSGENVMSEYTMTITKCTCNEITIKTEATFYGQTVSEEATSEYELSGDKLVMKPSSGDSRTFNRKK